MQRPEALSIHTGSIKEAAPTAVTTLYDVIAALQTMVPPEEDDVVVAIMAEWLRCGRLRFVHDVTIAA
jgi:hypothetical protein